MTRNSLKVSLETGTHTVMSPESIQPSHGESQGPESPCSLAHSPPPSAISPKSWAKPGPRRGVAIFSTSAAAIAPRKWCHRAHGLPRARFVHDFVRSTGARHGADSRRSAQSHEHGASGEPVVDRRAGERATYRLAVPLTHIRLFPSDRQASAPRRSSVSFVLAGRR